MSILEFGRSCQHCGEAHLSVSHASTERPPEVQSAARNRIPHDDPTAGYARRTLAIRDFWGAELWKLPQTPAAFTRRCPPSKESASSSRAARPGSARAIANLLGSEGAEIFACGRHQAELIDALESIRSTGALAAGEVADVSKPDDVKRIFKQADQSLGGLDIFINNAGVAGGGVEEEEDESWRYIVETNLLGYIGCAKEAINRMKPARKGHIVLIGSMSADLRSGGSSIYAATKSGIQASQRLSAKKSTPRESR